MTRDPVDWMKMGRSWSDKVEIPMGGPRVMDQFGDAVVLLISDSELIWRNEEMRGKGASFDYSEYQPHITVTYAKSDIAKIEPYQGKIILGPEIFEDIKDA